MDEDWGKQRWWVEGHTAKPVSAMDEVTVSWTVSKLVKGFSEEEVCLKDYMPVVDRNNIR